MTLLEGNVMFTKQQHTVTVTLDEGWETDAAKLELVATNYKKTWYAKVVASIVLKWLTEKKNAKFDIGSTYRLEMRREGRFVKYRAKFIRD